MTRESTIVNGWIREGREQGDLRRLRTSLLRAVKVRLADPVPEAIALAVEGTTDLSTLELWYDAALTAETVGALRKTMKIEP